MNKKIYIIDDNRYEELSNSCSFVKEKLFNEFVEWIQPDVTTTMSGIDDVACICWHTSLVVMKEGKYVSAERLKYEIGEKIGVFPMVEYSKGETEIVYNEQDMQIYMPKDLFYSRLESFVCNYIDTGNIALELLVEDSKETLETSSHVAYFGNSWAEMKDVDEYILQKINTEIDTIIIDLNSDIEQGLKVAFTLRLMVQQLGCGALAKIIFLYDDAVSGLFSFSTYSQILFTEGCYICASKNVIKTIETAHSLNTESYISGFLDRVYVKEDSSYGHHSLANEWGLMALSRFVSSDTSAIDSILANARKRLFFKYSVVKSLDIKSLLDSSKYVCSEKVIRNKPEGGKYLLIDDKASEGWEVVLKQCVEKYELFDSIDQEIDSYERLSLSIQNKIAKGYYDVIFLDLRLLSAEENRELAPDDMSGMNILKRIKQVNPGNQVIIFTASSKSWNLKALMDNGADEYYLKESPLYHFTEKESLANARHLIYAIKSCLWRNYLSKSYLRIRQLQEKYRSLDTRFSETYKDEIHEQFEIALHLILQTRNENDKDTFAYAFSALEFVFEQIVNVLEPGKNKMPSRIAKVISRCKSDVDEQFIFDAQRMIRARNAYIHKNSNLSRFNFVCQKDGFLKLLKIMSEFFNLILTND